MQPGTFELLILVFIFLGLQAWWIIPIVIKNNKLNSFSFAVNLFRLSTYLLVIILFFNRKDNFFMLMNYREDLEIKLQKVTLAIQEVVEDVYKTEQEKQKIIGKLIDFKEAIISKGIELHIELEAA